MKRNQGNDKLKWPERFQCPHCGGPVHSAGFSGFAFCWDCYRAIEPTERKPIIPKGLEGLAEEARKFVKPRTFQYAIEKALELHKKGQDTKLWRLWMKQNTSPETILRAEDLKPFKKLPHWGRAECIWQVAQRCADG